jgi:hypothetical protein
MDTVQILQTLTRVMLDHVSQSLPRHPQPENRFQWVNVHLRWREQQNLEPNIPHFGGLPWSQARVLTKYVSCVSLSNVDEPLAVVVTRPDVDTAKRRDESAREKTTVPFGPSSTSVAYNCITLEPKSHYRLTPMDSSAVLNPRSRPSYFRLEKCYVIGCV